MKASSIKYGVLTFTLTLVCLIIALLPFHAFLTVWGSTIFGHYTALRLWKEVLMAIAGLGFLYLILFDHKVRYHLFRRKLSWLILAYVAVQIIWALVALHGHTVRPLAIAYGVLLDSRFLIFFGLCWALALRTPRMERRWPMLLLWPAVVVVVFGLLEVFVLPPDFLKHFGYGPSTIMPFETINHNQDYYRYMSTLRGANPLGAYLLVPISALAVLLLRFPRSWNWARGLLLAGCLAMLFFSFSRGAWLGSVLSLGFAAIAVVGPQLFRRYRIATIVVVVGLLAVGAVTAFGLRHNTRLQNIFLHTQDHSAVATTSDGGHASALKNALTDVVHHPIGHGPGTAGPASVYNNNKSVFAENYYLQIGQEFGWLGLLLFGLIVGAVGCLLWLRRQTPLALSLLAALIGISFVGLLSHVWTDDTLAYVWWGLAGLAIGTPVEGALFVTPRKDVS